LAGGGVVVAEPEIIKPGFLVQILGGVAPWVTLRVGSGGGDFFAEGTIRVARQEVFIDVCQRDDVTGAIVKRDDFGGGVSFGFADEQ